MFDATNYNYIAGITIGFLETEYNIIEGSISVGVQVRVSDPLSSDVTVQIATSDGNATGKSMCVCVYNYVYLNSY